MIEVGTWALERTEGTEIRVHIQPRASKTEIVGVHGEALKIRIAAPPVDGQANAELFRFLAGRFSVPQHSVKVISGWNSRHKRVLIKGLTRMKMEAYLGQ